VIKQPSQGNTTALPPSVDWRKKNVVTSVKNQGYCGSCWAFAAAGALEAAYVQKYGQLITLSVQQLVDCADNYGNNGCLGGVPSAATAFVVGNTTEHKFGLDTDDQYPYNSQVRHSLGCVYRYRAIHRNVRISHIVRRVNM
jgi:C1A family cysteine protease